MASAFSDPVFLGMVVAILAFFFFIYLMIRRTIMGFREGFERDQK